MVNNFHNHGFAPIVFIIIVVAVLAAAGGGSYFAFKKEKHVIPSPFAAPKEEQKKEGLLTSPPVDISTKEKDQSPKIQPMPQSISPQTADPKKLLGIWKVEKIFAATPEGNFKEVSLPLPLFTQFREKDLCRQWKYLNNEGVCERYDSYSVTGNRITISDPQEGSVLWEWKIVDEKLELLHRQNGKLAGKTISGKAAKVFFDLFSQKVEPPKPHATALSPSALLGEWRLEKFLNYDSAAGQWKDAQGTATEFQEFLAKTMCDAYQIRDFADAKTFQCISYAPYTVNGDMIVMEAYNLISKSKSAVYYRWNIVGGKLELSVEISETPFLKYVYYKNLPSPPPPAKVAPTVTSLPSPVPSQKPKIAERVWWEFRYKWEPSGTPPPCPENLINVTPADISRVTAILYPGQYRGDHYKAHGGFGFETSNPNDVTVRMPQDGFVVSGVRYYESDELQYLFDIEHPCGIRFRFDHLRILSPKFQTIANMLPPPKINDTRGTRLNTPVAVTTGEVITTGVAFEHTPNTLTGFDFGMYDLRNTNKSAEDPAWRSQYWGDQAPYGVCWLDFLPSPDREIAKKLPAPGGNFEIKSDYCK